MEIKRIDKNINQLKIIKFIIKFNG